MAETTNIEWADSTWNPWMGCTKVSPACDHCYAERDTARFGRVQWGAGQPRVRTSAGNWKKPLQWNRAPFYECACGWRGDKIDEHKAACGYPDIGRIRPARRRVFCASLADVFDNDVDPAWRADLFSLIEQTPNLDWMLLTKRIGNADRMIQQARLALVGSTRLVVPDVLPNLWLGATICNQEEADRDIPKLLAIPVVVRFLSMEPLLRPVYLRLWEYEDSKERDGTGIVLTTRCRSLDWVIVGGESGPEARPMNPDWVRSLRDQCGTAGVPFLFKQWGEWAPYDRSRTDGKALSTPCSLDTPMQRVGKKVAGRVLDGAQHDGYPKGGAA